jgi:hypothetical protein
VQIAVVQSVTPPRREYKIFQTDSGLLCNCKPFKVTGKPCKHIQTLLEQQPRWKPDDLTVRGMIDRLETLMFPHQESEFEQESFTAEGRDRVAQWIRETVKADVALRQVAAEFIAYYTAREPAERNTCANCGGKPHSTTCFVGRFEKVLGESIR